MNETRTFRHGNMIRIVHLSSHVFVRNFFFVNSHYDTLQYFFIQKQWYWQVVAATENRFLEQH